MNEKIKESTKNALKKINIRQDKENCIEVSEKFTIRSGIARIFGL